jgi:hypothetical protein
MHIIENLNWWIPIVFGTIIWMIMQWNDKLPSIKSIQHFVSIINSRGGNILILGVATLYFFKYSMYIFMDLLNMVKDKTITQDNAFALMAIQFITTSAFGGAMGALLKTMTGESSTARSTDNIVDVPGTKVNSTTQTSISGTIPPIPPKTEEDAPKGPETAVNTSVDSNIKPTYQVIVHK